jgi:hypothetical protein
MTTSLLDLAKAAEVLAARELLEHGPTARDTDDLKKVLQMAREHDNTRFGASVMGESEEADKKVVAKMLQSQGMVDRMWNVVSPLLPPREEPYNRFVFANAHLLVAFPATPKSKLQTLSERFVTEIEKYATALADNKAPDAKPARVAAMVLAKATVVTKEMEVEMELDELLHALDDLYMTPKMCDIDGMLLEQARRIVDRIRDLTTQDKAKAVWKLFSQKFKER